MSVGAGPDYSFRVLLFGSIARDAGTSVIVVPHEQPSMAAAALLERISTHTPAIASMLSSSRIARNHAFAEATDVVSCDDELAVVGMVSGG